MPLTIHELGHLSVVLVRSRNPLNIGAAARAMSNFGFSSLRVVQPYDVAFREARSAVGANNLMQEALLFETIAEAVSDCELVVGTTALRNRELRHNLRDLTPGGRLIRRNLKAGRVALLFGSEKRGLSNEDLSHCHWLMRIPTHGAMNLGQAVAVCLYELARASNREVEPEKVARAAAGELERITQMLSEALRISGYTRTDAEHVTELNLRRLIRDMYLDTDDAKAWLGILRQVLWKLKSDE